MFDNKHINCGLLEIIFLTANSALTFRSTRWYNNPPLKPSATQDGLKAKPRLTLKIFLWKWHIIYPTSHYDEIPPCKRKENNFIQINMSTNLINYIKIIIYHLQV